MKGKYGGPMSVDDLYQAMLQDREFFRRHRIGHAKAIFLYFTPCDAAGNTVFIRDQCGSAIEGYQSAGVYQPAAAAYETGGIEPVTLYRLIIS